MSTKAKMTKIKDWKKWVKRTYESSSAQPDPGSDNRRKIKYFSKQF
jgi:hypothetical protein